jgi:hypothetical protein
VNAEPSELSERDRLERLRTFLSLLALGLFIGTCAELLLAEHYDDPIQIVPFALCGAGMVAVAIAWLHPTRAVNRIVRALMAIIASGSLLGIYEHLEGNLGFVHEVQPRAANLDALTEALHGAAPLLAPGILAVGAAVAVAATFAQAPVLSPSVAGRVAQSGVARPVRHHTGA